MNSSLRIIYRQVLVAPLVATLVFAMAINPASAQESDSSADTALRWKLSEGDAFISVLTQNTRITSEVDKQKRIVENEIVLKIQWDVEKTDDDEFSILQKIASLKLNTVSPTTGKQVRIDTDASPDKVTKLEKSIMKQLEPIVGSEFKLLLSNRGDVVNVSIDEPTLEKLRQIPGSLKVRELFSPEGLKSIYGKSLMLFPNESVSNGFTWQSQTDRETPLGKLSETNEYKVKRPDGQPNFEVEIVTSVVQPEASDEKIQVDPSGQQIVRPKLEKFSGTGSLVMDAKNEFVRESQFRNVMVTSRPYRELTLTTEVETTITTTLERGRISEPEPGKNSSDNNNA